MDYQTEQELFWAGDFGNEYTQRNQGEELLASNIDFFCKALHRARDVKSCIEFGANMGMNLKALQLIRPKIDAHAIEINKEAAKKLKETISEEKIYMESILDFKVENKFDLVLIKGVLIHIDPGMLPVVYEKLFNSCGRYLLVAEYYNPSPVSVSYRGHSDKLFKRDFAGEMMKEYPQLRLIDYGFVYHKDPNYPQDDITWFLMEKF